MRSGARCAGSPTMAMLRGGRRGRREKGAGRRERTAGRGGGGVRQAASGATAIVSPLAAELAGVVAAATGLRRLRLGGGWAARGWLAERPVLLAVTGDGERSAARGLERLLAAARPERLLVVGVAGGLSPE